MEAPANVEPEDPADFYEVGQLGNQRRCLDTRQSDCNGICYFLDIDPKGPWDSIIHAAPMSHGSGSLQHPSRYEGQLPRDTRRQQF